MKTGNYEVEFCAKRGGVIKVFIFRVCEPIIHPAVCADFGPNYGRMVAWSRDDAQRQLSSLKYSTLIPQNQAARDLLETDRKKFYQLNEQIRKTKSCAVCKQPEKDRRTLFACSDGHVYHILCGLSKHCPVCV